MPTDLDPNDLVVFAQVAEEGSFSRAADKLSLPKSTVSRRLAALEERLGERLLLRTTRRQSLTEFGHLLLEHARQVVAELDAVAALREQLAARAVRVEVRYRNSLEAVAALAQGDCELAGFHLPLGEFQAAAAARYAPWLDRHQHRLGHLAVRTQGLFVAAGNPLGVRGVADLARSDLRFVNRPEGSGTRVLTDLLLQRHGIAPRQVSGYDSTELTHAAVAAFVASGMADVGMGVQTAAHRFGLHFIPLLKERYFFALPADALAWMQARGTVSRVIELRTMLRTDTGRAQLIELMSADGAYPLYGTVALQPAGSEIVFICVTGSPQVEDLVFGQQGVQTRIATRLRDGGPPERTQACHPSISSHTPLAPAGEGTLLPQPGHSGCKSTGWQSWYEVNSTT